MTVAAKDRAPLTLILAMADDGAIGLGGKLPWRISEDLKFFKAQTMGHAIIMGRKTWDEVGKPLPGRRNIVVSRDRSLTLEGAEVVGSLDEAIRLARTADADPHVIGGAAIFNEAMPLATRIFLTEVHRKVEADTYFHGLDRSAFRETARRRAETVPDVEFVTLER